MTAETETSPSPRPRVLSLLSAATEIVCRLGCAHLLVGRSHGCDDPPFVTTLPIATAPKVDPNAPSSELDKQVRVQSATGGAIYQINNELVKRLQPTVIITQEQCRICAVTPDDLSAACDMNELDPLVKLVTIMPVTLEDVLGDIITIAKAIGVEDRGIRLVKQVKQQLDSIQSVSMDILGGSNRPKVAHVEWLKPLMGSGYWIYDCVKFAGGEMKHGKSGGHSQILEKISLLSNVDYIIISPCGFSIERTNEELNNIGLLDTNEWRDLPAVKNGRVAICDGNKYFNRSSVASILGTSEMVAEIIHPELCGMYSWFMDGKCHSSLDTNMVYRCCSRLYSCEMSQGCCTRCCRRDYTFLFFVKDFYTTIMQYELTHTLYSSVFLLLFPSSAFFDTSAAFRFCCCQ